MKRIGFIAFILVTATLLFFLWITNTTGQEDSNLISMEMTGIPRETLAAEPDTSELKDDCKERIAARGEAFSIDSESEHGATAGMITGTIVERVTNAPIKDALVLVGPDVPAFNVSDVEWIASTRSDDEGMFAFQGITSAPHRIRVAASGRQSMEARSVFPGEDEKFLLSRDLGMSCALVVETEEGEEALPDQEVILEAHSHGWMLAIETDHKGTFIITGIDRDWLELTNSSGTLRIVVPGYLDPVLELASDTREPGYTITVQQGTTVTGQVVDKDRGGAIPGAEIIADSGHFIHADEQGCFNISGVFDTLCARAPGYALSVQELDDIPGGVEFENVDLLFELEQGVALHGRVIDTDEQPVSGVCVGVAPFSLDLDVEDQRLERTILQAYRAITDKAGRYRIENLSAQAMDLPGMLDLNVRPAGWFGGIEEEVHIENPWGEVEHDIVLRLINRFSGSVLDLDGEPVTGATVLLLGIEESHYQLKSTDGEGQFFFSDLPIGSYQAAVLVNDEPLLLQALEIPSPPQVLRVQPAQDVSGTVVRKSDGEPVFPLGVQLVYCQGALMLTQRTMVDDKGQFFFDRVPPGTHSLWLMHLDGVPLYSPFFPGHKETIEVRQEPWCEIIRYRERPSGWVRFTFAVEGADGTQNPPCDPVEIRMTTFRYSRQSSLGKIDRFKGRPLPGVILEEGKGVSLGHDAGRFDVYLRQGEYGFRFLLPPGDKSMVQEKIITVDAGEITENRIVFEIPKEEQR